MCHVDHHNSFMLKINSCLNPVQSFMLFNQSYSQMQTAVHIHSVTVYLCLGCF